MKVLIVKLSSLGDVVHAMPAVQDLRRALPGVTVDWVVERAFAPLVSRCEGVRRIVPCDLRRWRKALWSAQTRQEWRAFKADLQQEQYDAVIDLQGLTKSALVAWLARLAPHGKRYGLANQTEGSGYEAPARWVAHTAITLEPHVHAVQRARLLCAEALGYAVEGPPLCGLKPGVQAALPPVSLPALAPLSVNKHNAFAPRMPTVALVHGTSRADKAWPLDAWVAVGQRLNHAGFTVALAHGSVAERKTSELIAAQLEHTWMWPLMPLDSLVDTMAHCAGVIGVDSGLSHVAVALNLAHVQIYNFDTAWRTGPQSSRQLSVFAAPHPDVETVWAAWESLGTPVLCQ
ncbi:lipopolysaccharide heptosyltransferase I [Rhodoferax aquaticus]|uniref:Lipopolysaccharide heptosyltransferase 1 n=1 Tax=Rhodoferax aquaticus TaxID=2527691 RepID=A0A515EML3_9BURK|nr:lipopolysaccharide heptosyltransferase I [Rhodoferax aquaticus]QDL53882.1 lipopolysaccharide heptosyltransferase I [Rhodoferax aquaticus]